ncbi:zinc-finger dna-binding family protein [Acanthamoeba castellanii str. Neff]|uniref:Zinc-finger dna-binding family protein n=1 Tax=Acanthamoeba castellanii (strain ATCC 30010 / Neff) TaxID=1257118 RepID=L8GKV9_ACACF|nr:zinc-finger dna-binding family protein [Acanthamoeba castellanii str. Neff]ELR13368.1 zinc-finger dna-binding family protein [Acanthamoeba castellanii str. Neff]
MGKSGGFLTPKAIANRIKAKGLQKLRWYCQMCEKQCRDENGFKCHTSSESHQRQMAIFSDNPNKFLDEFSVEFEDSFIRHLRHRHGTKRVHANLVYAELIRDRNHLHMNATKWTSLTEFVKYLGRTGKATTLARQKALERRKKSDIDEEERERLRIEKQLEEARRQREALGLSADADAGHDEPGEKESADGSEADGGGVKLEGVKIAFSLGGLKKQPLTLGKTEEKPHDDDEKGHKMNEAEADREARKRKPDDVSADREHGERDRDRDRRGREDEERDSKRARSSRWDKAASSTSTSSSSSSTTSSSTSWPGGEAQADANANELEKEKKEREMEMEKERKETTKRTKATTTKTDYWLADGIVVKVKHKTVGGGKYYNQKGVIEQDFLETVLPALEGRVLVLNGAHRGERATLKAIDVDKFCATIQLSSSGELVKGIAYEDIAKLA